MNQPQMDWQLSKTNLSSRFKELFINSLWTDCAFRVGDGQTEILRGHKIVLAGASPVFEALFYGTLAEKNEIIEVPDLQPDTFRLFLKYIYCDCTEVENVDTAGHLLYAAKKYMVPHLTRVCLDYLLEHTCINTLWDVLAVAEDLHEDELMASCLKVMCQYPGEMWVSNNEQIGLVTLSKLLDQPSINLLEVELWQLVAAWANDECVLRNLAPTTANKRTLINQAGILGKVRFLTLSLAELAEVVEPSGLLSDEEIRALRRSISLLNSSKVMSSSNNSIVPESVTVPVGFNTTREMRKRFMSISSRCVRHCMTKRKQYTYRGKIKTKISVDSRVLVTGFEVYTRIASPADYIMGRGSVDRYYEDLVMSLCDEEGNLLNRTEVNGVVTFFNVIQELYLSEPVWFLPNQKYTVTFELSTGQYPLSDLSPVAFSRSVCFHFSQCEHLEDSVFVDLDVSFINGVIYSI